MLPGVASALIAGGAVDEDSRARLAPLLAFAERVGAERIVFCHGLSRKHVTADDIRRFSGLLSELGKETQQRGIQLSLHHHYDQPVMYREDFDIFFDRLPEKTVGLTVDTAHLVKSGITDIAEIVTGFAPYIDNFHMKDFADGAGAAVKSRLRRGSRTCRCCAPALRVIASGRGEVRRGRCCGRRTRRSSTPAGSGGGPR